MKPKRIERKKIRYGTVTVRVTDEEKEVIQNLADKEGLTMSAYLRSKVIARLKDEMEAV